MALTKADLEAIASLVDARISARVTTVKGKARVKAARDTRTMAERRDAAVGGVCEQHGKRFATANGYAYHMEHTAHDDAE